MYGRGEGCVEGLVAGLCDFSRFYVARGKEGGREMMSRGGEMRARQGMGVNPERARALARVSAREEVSGPKERPHLQPRQ